MTAAFHKIPGTAQTPAYPEALFGRSAEGLAVARVADNTFAMVPGRDGGHYLATAGALPARLPIGRAPISTAMRATSPTRQRFVFASRRIPSTSSSAPWGPSQGATVYADGVICHSTAGHGGFHLDPARNEKVHPLLRAADGFYEQDCC